MNDRLFHHSKSHKLEDPERLKWLPPAEVLSRLQLAPGDRVADIGAGTGFFAIPMAQAVGLSGHIFAVDLQQEMLDLLRQKLDRPETPKNITLHRGAASELPLADHSVGLAFYANIWHELDDADATYREALRIAVPQGKIAILDWRRDKESPPGPPTEHRIDAESIASFLRSNGCQQVACYNIGEFNYLIAAELPLRT